MTADLSFTGGGTDTMVGDFGNGMLSHIIWQGGEGHGRAVCGARGTLPLPTPTPEVTCKRCLAWALEHRPSQVRP